MTQPPRHASSIAILMVDDDDDDYLLTQRALKESKILDNLVRVSDGEEMFDYLRHAGEFADTDAPLPDVILLDLNMPRMDGREALRQLKLDDKLRHIPVVVFTTSKAEEDIVRSYQLGVSSFITKPVTFDGLKDVMQRLGMYWFDLVELPNGTNRRT